MMMPVFLSRLLALTIPGARHVGTFPIASLPHNLTIFFWCDSKATDPLDPFLTLTPFYFLRDSKATAPLNPFLMSSYLFSSSLFFFIFFFFFFFPLF
jgi:hypothetical protein